jgi:hypothetical protein
MQVIKIFYHATDLPGWETITGDQIDKMISSGLLARSDLYIHMNYDENNFVEFRKNYENYPNIHWIYKQNLKQDYEFPTIISLKEMADSTDEEFYALYLHQKGVTYLNKPTETQIQHWRLIMDYWDIERWKDCVKALDEGYDAAGALHNSENVWPHFSGNFWWTKASFLRKCKPLILPSTVNFQAQFGHGDVYRVDSEAWLGSNDPKCFCPYRTGANHYFQEWPPELYR